MLPKLHVVVCSTRPSRIGPAVAEWFFRHAQEDETVDASLVDLVEVGLPLFDEPVHPRRGDYRHDHTKRWAAIVREADAFAFVAPEYNHGPTPALVNAITYLSSEWAHKPAGFVSYGGRSGGLRGVQAMKPILSALEMYPTKAGVVVHNVRPLIEDGTFTPPDSLDGEARGLIRELAQLAVGLQSLRKEDA